MIEWAAGLAGGCAGVVVGHPFDTVKVKLQTQDFRNPQYKGTWDCFSKTIRKDGARGLYRGMTSPLAGVGAINAIIFGVHGNVSRQFENPDALSTHFFSGICAGVVQAFISSPVELTKTRLQIQTDALASGTISSARYQGALDCLSKIYKTEGIRGVFRGQLITICREIPGFGTYFLSYEWMVRNMAQGEPGPLSILFAGGMAGTASWLFSYPIDVVKSRVQSDGAFGPARYKGAMDCLSKSVKEEGLGVMTRGLTSTILRAFPTNAATFFVVSSVMKHCSHLEEEGIDLTAVNEVLNTGMLMFETSIAGQEIKRLQGNLTQVADYNVLQQ